MVVSSFGVNENEINKSQQKTNTTFEKSSIEKSKKPVQVTRGGKTFIQMREEGKKTAQELYNEARQSLEEFFELHDIAFNEVDPGMIESLNEDLNLGLSDSEKMRALKYFQNKKELNLDPKKIEEAKQSTEDVKSLMNSIEDKANAKGSIIAGEDDDWKKRNHAFLDFKNDMKDLIREKVDKIESLQLGIKNLEANLDSAIAGLKNRLDFISDSYDEEMTDSHRKRLEWDTAKTEAKLDGFLRAKELLNDGLKHLL
mgnify:CR=1 FL=1